MSIVSAAYRPNDAKFASAFSARVLDLQSHSPSLAISVLLRLTTRRACTNIVALAGSSYSMALSDMAARRAKATGKAYSLYDTLGLSLAVTANAGQELAMA